MAKLSKEQWAAARKQWESDPRGGFAWLADELNNVVDRTAIGKMAKRNGWNKSATTGAEKVSRPVKNVPPQKSPPGRPTDYHEDFNDQAKKLCMLGHTNDDLAFFFEVSPSTIDNWMVKHSEFLGAVKAGRLVADMNVAASLYERAVGYSCTETKVFCVNGQIIEHDVIKHYPPEVGAAKYWLNNRQPELWKEKVVLEQDMTVAMVPTEELDAIHERNLLIQKEKAKAILGRAHRLGICSYIEGADKVSSDDS